MAMLKAIQRRRIAKNRPMKVQLPPKLASLSDIRSPNVRFRELGFDVLGERFMVGEALHDILVELGELAALARQQLGHVAGAISIEVRRQMKPSPGRSGHSSRTCSMMVGRTMSSRTASRAGTSLPHTEQTWRVRARRLDMTGIVCSRRQLGALDLRAEMSIGASRP